MIFSGPDAAVESGTTRVAILAQYMMAVGGFRKLGFSDMKLSFSLALAALIIFVLRGQVLWLPGLALAVGNSVGGWIGSQLSVLKGESWIRNAFFVALFIMPIKLLWPT